MIFTFPFIFDNFRLFNWNMSPVLLFYWWHLVCLINHCGVNSTHTVHQGLLCCFTLYIAFFGGILARHSLSFSGKLLVGFVSSGAAAQGSNVLWFTPPIQTSTIDTTWVESPSMLQIVLLHCTLPESIVQAYHQVQTSVETISYIEGARSGGILLRCEILVLPWELVLHCMCTLLKWNRLVLTSLRIITHHVWSGWFGWF